MQRWLATRVAFFLLALGTSATALVAQTGSIRGRVIDSTGTPIPGTLLAVERTAVRTQATAAGNYALIGVPAGTRSVRAQIIGFAPVTVDVTVKANETVTQHITLVRSAV